MRIVWSTPASADLRSIFDYIRADDPHTAALVVRRIRDRVDQLSLLPGLGRVGRVADTRELVVSRTPYVVAYRIEPDRISIARVIHGRRLWPPGSRD